MEAGLLYLLRQYPKSEGREKGGVELVIFSSKWIDTWVSLSILEFNCRIIGIEIETHEFKLWDSWEREESFVRVI